MRGCAIWIWAVYGELTIAFAKMGAGDVTGVDFVPRSIERARA